MNWEKIKGGITKEIEYIMHTIDPAIDMDHCLNIYFKLLHFKISRTAKDNLDGLEKNLIAVLEEIFDKGIIGDLSTGIFCKNFEQFIKQIYYILEEGDYISRDNIVDQSSLKTLTPFLAALNKVRPIYKDSKGQDVFEIQLAHYVDGLPVYKKSGEGQVLYQRLYSSSLRFDKYTSIKDTEMNSEFNNSFILYLLKAIILKNEQSHQVPEQNKIESITNITTTLIAELWIVNFFNKELSTVLKGASTQTKNFEEYINTELNRLQKQSSKFVYLNLKELLKHNENGRSGFIDKLIESNLKRMRILGQGGSGKTTTLDYLYYKNAKKWQTSPDDFNLPVLIALSNVAANESIVENISKKISSSIEYVEELFETNRITLYLDGINEIVENRESKKLKLQEISSMIEDYPELNLIVTDRYEFDNYQNNMFDIPTFLIQKLTKDKIAEFVLKYCNNDETLSEHVLSILKSKQNISDIFLRPLVLTRAIEIIKIENDLPEKEGHIIEKFLDILLIREKDEKKDPLLNITNFKLLLAYAANEIFKQYDTNAAINEFKFNKLLVEASEKYGLEKSNAGYTSRIGYELEILSKTDDMISFYHQSYLEFFCKHYLKYESQ